MVALVILKRTHFLRALLSASPMFPNVADIVECVVNISLLKFKLHSNDECFLPGALDENVTI